MLDKYQLAIVKYAENQIEIKKLTNQIGTLLSDCVYKNYGNDVDEHSKPCLFEAYSNVSRYQENNYSNAVDFLNNEKDGCKFCLEANKLIQQRKLAKQSFGRAKGQITKLAKALKIDERRIS